MPKNDFDRLFERLESLSVGFGPVFRDFASYAQPSYPPHNIVSESENRLRIELAVAGFKKSDITIEEHQGILTITGNKESQSESLDYRHRGIANRSFTKSFRIAEYYEVKEASLEDGILSVLCIKNAPEVEKPKLISIS